jgi:hypothetical protein
MNLKSIVTGLIVGPIFAAVGFFVAFYFGKPILDNAARSKEWPTVVGVVERSEVVTRRDKDGTMYSADVAYKYEVDQREYRSSNVSFGGGFSSSSSGWANKLVNRYPVGKEIDVHYDPEEPGNSVLEPGTNWTSYIVYGIGLLFLAIGVLVAGTSLFYVGFATLITGGALAGVIGNRKRKVASNRGEANYRPMQNASSDSEKKAPRQNSNHTSSDDDGFDIS